MSQPVKVSDELILDARLTGEIAERSIAGQIEFWAQLGRAIEPLIRGDCALALRQSGDARPVSEAIARADSKTGRERVRRYLQSRPYPHFESAPEADGSGLLVRIEEDGTRTLGRLVNREFLPAAAETETE